MGTEQMHNKGMRALTAAVWVGLLMFGPAAVDVCASETAAAGGTPEWGVLAVKLPEDACRYVAGEQVTVTLSVSGLLEPINGVQALVRFDTAALTLDGVDVGDGAGSAWDDSALLSDIDGGSANLGFILLGDSTDADGVVARLQFTTVFGGDDLLADVNIVEQDGPLMSRLTLASDGGPVLPTLETPARIGHLDDAEPDGDIDLFDFDAFVDCVTGPDPQEPLGDCCRFDVDEDDDVDMADYVEFSLSFTGSIDP